jgi:general secretion pathway protein C
VDLVPTLPAARIRSLVIVVLGGVVITQILGSFSTFRHLLKPAPMVLAGGILHSNPPLLTSLIVAAHLFGASPDSPAASSQATAEAGPPDLKLVGTLARRNPTKGSAIIARGAAGTHLVAASEPIDGSTRLTEVYADHVVIEWRGSRRTLYLRVDSHGSHLLAQMQAQPTETEDEDPDDQPPETRTPRPRPHYANSYAILDNIDYNYAQQGIKIVAAKDPDRLAQQGLQEDDVITAVNGTPVDSTARVQGLLKALSSEGAVNATVIRDGQTQTLLLRGE